MFSSKKLIALVATALVVAFGYTKTASATVTVMAEDGWKVSFDGSVNSFYVNTSEDKPKGSKTGAGLSTMSAGDKDHSGITVGLLPAVFAINIHSPTMDGLDMKARLGLYPSTQNNSVKNQNNPATGGQNGSNLDLREIYFAVDGDHGQFLVGRTLSLFLGKNILTDMTLFGVGAVGLGGGGGIGGGTTLGRIGYGYVYPNFNAAIRYSTPDMNGFKATIGVYNPSVINANGAGASGLSAGVKADTTDTETIATADKDNDASLVLRKALANDNPNAVITTAVSGSNTVYTATTKGSKGTPLKLSADETSSPRFEGELSYAADMDGVGISAWVNGMFQSADLTDGAKATCASNVEAARAILGDVSLNGSCSDVDAFGIGGGLQVSYMGITLTGSGYSGEALGTTLMLDNDAMDPLGEEREHYGYIAQATYDFGQGTNIGVSYGASLADETKFDSALLKKAKADDTSDSSITLGIEEQSLLDVMVWHNINSNLRVVAEYGMQETEWFDGSDQEVDIFSVGGFFFW